MGGRLCWSPAAGRDTRRAWGWRRYPWNSPESRQWVEAAGCPACCQELRGKGERGREEADPGLGTLLAHPPPTGLHLDPTWEGSGSSLRPRGGNGFPGPIFILGSLRSLGHLPEGPSLRWSLGVPVPGSKAFVMAVPGQGGAGRDALESARSSDAPFCSTQRQTSPCSPGPVSAWSRERVTATWGWVI